MYSLTSYCRNGVSNLTFCGVPSLAASSPLLSVFTRWLWCRYLALSSVLAEPVVLAASSRRSLDRCLLQLHWMNSSSPDANNPEFLEHRSPCQKSDRCDQSFTSVMGSLFCRAGSVTKEVVLGSGLVVGGRWSQNYCIGCIEPRCIIVSQYPNSWAYSCNMYSHRQSYNQYN